MPTLASRLWHSAVSSIRQARPASAASSSPSTARNAAASVSPPPSNGWMQRSDNTGSTGNSEQNQPTRSGQEDSIGVYHEFHDMVPFTFICPVSRNIMRDPVIDKEGNTYDRATIEAWLDSGNTVSPLTHTPMRKSDLTANRALRNTIEEYVEERGGIQNIPQILAASAPPPALLSWRDSPLARAKTMRAVALKISVPALTPEQAEEVAQSFGSVLIHDAARWYPELDAPLPLRAAVQRVRWAADSRFRLRIYGEFAQWLRPHVAFDDLGLLDAQVKRDAQAAYLAASVRPDLAAELDVIRAAIADFSQLYNRLPTEYDARIRAEQARRWTFA